MAIKKLRLFDLETKRYRLVTPSQIICLQASGSYTNVFVADDARRLTFKMYNSGYGLCRFEKALAKHGFVRVNKSMVVNPDYVIGITDENTLQLPYDCCECIDLSPVYKPVFKEQVLISLNG